MAKKIPFDDDVMTMIMGVGGSEEPGQHGRTHAPMPSKDAIDVLTEIRDMCDEFLNKVDKNTEENKEDKENNKDNEDEEEEE